MHSMEIKFMPHLRCNVDTKQKQCLQNAIMKHKQVLANLVELKLGDFEEIDSLIRELEDQTIR